MVDGFFEIIRAPNRQAAATSRFILVCRGGRLFGADPKGRVCTGKLLLQPKRIDRRFALRATYEIPLKRLSARHDPWPRSSIRVPVAGEIDPSAKSQNATVFVGTRKIDIEITYLGPLPS
ncbi:MAG: hypothetical protein QM780_14765 [Hyphomicrobium sp.]|uniref:hypothetical protein n=1 Tax=Hyphomicrobium sp. TaxID=82 RepID=UPI0039E6D9B1